MDENAFANDEYGQFQNEVFVNAVNGNFVSHDIGGVVEWMNGNFRANGLIMDVGDDGEDGSGEETTNFQYYALMLAYRLDSSWGRGQLSCHWITDQFGFFRPGR